MAAALRAVDGAAVTRRACETYASALRRRRVRLLAAGKVAASMASAFLDAGPAHVEEGLVIAPVASDLSAPLVCMAAAHPVPDSRSEAAGRAALLLAGRVQADDLFVVLLSGGASALMAVPAAALSLADKSAVTSTLLARGADITALNTVRKHLSAIKGGRLAATCAGELLAWALSDVVGDDLSVIASGPTVPDPTTIHDARGVLDAFGGASTYPQAVVAHLASRDPRAETPKPGDPTFARTSTRVIGSASLCRQAASSAARELGYTVVMHDTPVVGEARTAAERYGQFLMGLPASGRLCVVSSGETTVKVRGSGRGGRNHEFALALAPTIQGRREIVVASVGTDGVDGLSEAAGAYVDQTTASRARQQGLDRAAALNDNDSWTFFDALGDVIQTGPTHTNVGDLQVALLLPGRDS